MADSPAGAAGDLFPGFAEHKVDLGDVTLYARSGGSGPGLLLLHGYPQSHVMWHRMAPALAERHTVVAADIRGYGRSSRPPTDLEHRPYSKRQMAADMHALMRELGFDRFRVMGHDRGARVAYRLALDHKAAIERLVILDILSTHDQWSAVTHDMRVRMFHWAFLAQPAPMPETLIANAPDDWLDGRIKRGVKARSVSVLDPRAVADYRRCMHDADCVHAACEDFRAGATCDLADDEADIAAGRRIDCPTLMLWATHGPLAGLPDPLALWRPWCATLSGSPVDAGHFLAEENPDAVLAEVLAFLAA